VKTALTKKTESGQITCQEQTGHFTCQQQRRGRSTALFSMTALIGPDGCIASIPHTSSTPVNALEASTPNDGAGILAEILADRPGDDEE
jgi:hypothetical protein